MSKLRYVLPLVLFGGTAQADDNLAPPYTIDPGPHARDWEATLTGTGQSTDDFDDSSFGVTGSLGYYLTKNFVMTVKQGAQIASANDTTLGGGRTIVQAAWQWDFAKWQPYIGMNAGGVYGAAVRDEFVAGPEIGLKYYVNESTFMFGNIGYEVPVDECCNNGVVPYSLGIGFNF